MRASLVALAGVAAVLSCADGGLYGTGDEGNPRALQGVYSGTAVAEVDGVSLPLEVAFYLTQTGNAITGTMQSFHVPLAASYSNASVSGAISGTTLSFTLTQTHPCGGTLQGSAAIEGNGARLTGTFSGTSSCSTSIGASFVVDRTTPPH